MGMNPAIIGADHQMLLTRRALDQRNIAIPRRFIRTTGPEFLCLKDEVNRHEIVAFQAISPIALCIDAQCDQANTIQGEIGITTKEPKGCSDMAQRTDRNIIRCHPAPG
jgi:hypothetical protein